MCPVRKESANSTYWQDIEIQQGIACRKLDQHLNMSLDRMESSLPGQYMDMPSLERMPCMNFVHLLNMCRPDNELRSRGPRKGNSYRLDIYRNECGLMSP